MVIKYSGKNDFESVRALDCLLGVVSNLGEQT